MISLFYVADLTRLKGLHLKGALQLPRNHKLRNFQSKTEFTQLLVCTLKKMSTIWVLMNNTRNSCRTFKIISEPTRKIIKTAVHSNSVRKLIIFKFKSSTLWSFRKWWLLSNSHQYRSWYISTWSFGPNTNVVRGNYWKLLSDGLIVRELQYTRKVKWNTLTSGTWNSDF